MSEELVAYVTKLLGKNCYAVATSTEIVSVYDLESHELGCRTPHIIFMVEKGSESSIYDRDTIILFSDKKDKYENMSISRVGLFSLSTQLNKKIIIFQTR